MTIVPKWTSVPTGAKKIADIWYLFPPNGLLVLKTLATEGNSTAWTLHNKLHLQYSSIHVATKNLQNLDLIEVDDTEKFGRNPNIRLKNFRLTINGLLLSIFSIARFQSSNGNLHLENLPVQPSGRTVAEEHRRLAIHNKNFLPLIFNHWPSVQAKKLEDLMIRYLRVAVNPVKITLEPIKTRRKKRRDSIFGLDSLFGFGSGEGYGVYKDRLAMEVYQNLLDLLFENPAKDKWIKETQETIKNHERLRREFLADKEWNKFTRTYLQERFRKIDEERSKLSRLQSMLNNLHSQ